MESKLGRYLSEGILAGRKHSISNTSTTAIKETVIDWYKEHVYGESDFYNAVEVEDGWVVKDGYNEDYTNDVQILKFYRENSYSLRVMYDVHSKKDLDIPDFISRNWIRLFWEFNMYINDPVPVEFLSNNTRVNFEAEGKHEMSFSEFKKLLEYYKDISSFNIYGSQCVVNGDTIDTREIQCTEHTDINHCIEFHCNKLVLDYDSVNIRDVKFFTKELLIMNPRGNDIELGVGEVENLTIIDPCKVKIANTAVGNIGTLIEEFPNCKFIIKPSAVKLSKQVFKIEIDNTPKDALGNALKVGDNVLFSTFDHVSSHGSRSGFHAAIDSIKSVGVKIKVGARMQDPSDVVSLCGEKYTLDNANDYSKEELIGKVVAYIHSVGNLKTGLNIRFGRVLDLRYRNCILDNGDKFSQSVCYVFDPQLLKKIDKIGKYKHLY